MSRVYVPCYGPHRGTLVSRETGEPVARSGAMVHPVAIPDRPWDQIGHARGSVSLMEGQLVAAGHSPDSARRIAVTAARRADGEHGGSIPYHTHDDDRS